MNNNNQEEYLKAYYENEHDANKQMSYALAFTAVIIGIIMIGYIANLFVVTQSTRIITIIVMATSVVLLLTPLFWSKTDRLKKPGFKYFVLLTFLGVICFLNIIIPKHAIIGWAISLVLVNHYYNPKVGKQVFIATLILMLVCIYAAMFLGEYDPNLLMGELDEKTNLIHHFSDYSLTFPDTIQGRYEYLSYLKSIGRNRYITAFVFYYLARAAIITIIFFVSNSLNKRTYNLLVEEIKVSMHQTQQGKELEIANTIQMSALPESFKSNADIEIIANLTPAKEVGGDFYDYYQLDDNHIGILIGDVSGKGIPAAMFMMKTITCFKNYVSASKSPATIMREVNRAIYDGNKQEMFVTCFLAILDTNTGVLKYANAGHNPPVIGSNGNFSFLKCQSGFLLGAMEEAFVCDEEIKLNKGDYFMVYTDGITEARNDKGEFYGDVRLLKLFNKQEYDSIIDLHSELKDDIEAFVNGADQSDDITYLSLRYKGGVNAYEAIIVPAEIDQVKTIIDFVDQFLLKHDLGAYQVQLSIVVDEIFSNIAKYAYTEEKGDVYLRILINNKKELSLTFIDKGVPFNQLEKDSQLIDENYQNRKPGGLGTHIVKEFATSYRYNHINGKNLLVIKKKL